MNLYQKPYSMRQTYTKLFLELLYNSWLYTIVSSAFKTTKNVSADVDNTLSAEIYKFRI